MVRIQMHLISDFNTTSPDSIYAKVNDGSAKAVPSTDTTQYAIIPKAYNFEIHSD